MGSEAPIIVDEAALAQRMRVPAVHHDLSPIQMGTAEDLLSFFLMGTAGARAFGAGGSINTDDNLGLEFSAPASQGMAGLEARNILALAESRESLAPYARTPSRGPGDWDRLLDTGRAFDPAHAAFLLDHGSPGTARLLSSVQARDPGYAPLRFLLAEKEFWERGEPALVAEDRFDVRAPSGEHTVLRIAAVRQFVGPGRVLVSFVDNARREIYGQRYVDGEYDRLEDEVRQYVAETMSALRAAAGSVPSRSRTGVGSESETVAALREEASRRVGNISAQAAR